MKIIFSDTELLDALRKNDARAWEEIFSRWYRQLCYFSESIVHDKAEAEDIATGSFLKLLEKRPVVDGLDKLKSFLFTIARNRSLDFLKTSGRHAASHEEIRYLGPVQEAAVDLALIRSEALQLIYSAMEDLPPQCKEVMRLSFVEGKTLSEIAAEMGIAYQTVQNQKQRGIKLLRLALLDKDGIPPAVLILGLMILQENTHIFSAI